MPAVDFVKSLNNSYYFHSTEEYDATHPDIAHDAAIAWDRILSALKIKIKYLKEYNIVDIGSGTGFVATRCLESRISFKNYIGLEPSDTMRKRAVYKLRDPRVSFIPYEITIPVSNIIKQIPGRKIITINSVLHHIVYWEDFLSDLKNSLYPDDLLVLSHEPNCRFWENNILVDNFNKYLRKK